MVFFLQLVSGGNMESAAGSAVLIFTGAYLLFGLWLSSWRPKCKKCGASCEMTGPHGCMIICTKCGQDQAGL